ncbi:MAG: D-alanine--D-alanine ligase, partial [Firmicutes bacterium]|nr:D-alanine--D-alanine ligase [Bacillota bacterium]
NEINSIPGSLGFYLFEGILSFPDIIETLICGALKSKYDKSLKLTSFKTNVLHSNKQLKK